MTDGDVIASDDTKAEHPYGEKIPFLCWLFDSSDKRHVWCMNLVTTLAVLKNGLEYPMSWRFWVKADDSNEKRTKLDLAKEMLADFRKFNKARLWVAMDRWFLCKKFFQWLEDNNFDWVTKAKRNTVLYRLVYDPQRQKETYVKLNPRLLPQEIYPRLRAISKGTVISIPGIYLKVPYETLIRKGKPITRQKFVPVAAIAATHQKQATEYSLLQEEEAAATFRFVPTD